MALMSEIAVCIKNIPSYNFNLKTNKPVTITASPLPYTP